MSALKYYLGDGVYVDFDGFAFVLTTENGIPPPQNEIILEPQVIEALLRYVERIGSELKQRREGAKAG